MLRSLMLRFARHCPTVGNASATSFQSIWRHGGKVAARPWPHQSMAGQTWQTRTVKIGRPRLPRAAAASASLAADADISEAIKAACEALGRKPGTAEEQLVQRLHDNWFHTAGDLASMSDADAASLKLPLRLRSQVSLLLQAQPILMPSHQQPTDGNIPHHAAELLHISSGVAATASELASGPGAAAAAAAQDDGSGENTTAAAAAAAAEPDLGSIPIEERRCPPAGRFDNRSDRAPKVFKKSKVEPYALKESEMSEQLREEFAAFDRFCTVRFFGQQTDPIAPVTAAKYAHHLRMFLGWLHRERGVPLAQLSLTMTLPSSGREGVAVAFDYLQWLRVERGVGVRTERMALRSIQQGAKFLYHGQSKVRVGSGDKPYSDLEVVKELRLLDSAARKAEKVAPRAADEAAKWLDWPEFLALVEELRKECAGRDALGRQRSPVAVAWSLQRYLIFAILSCVPDRQRTLRELEVGRNLFKEKDRWVIRHGPSDYKTGRVYGERPPLIIAPHIYPELEAFIGKWRAELQPQHNFLFSQQNGKPMTEQAVHKVFSTTSFRLTGKKCNPHLVRDSIVTYLRGAGASERELEALAIYMGHSVEMQRDTYDRRTKQQKVAPAVELLDSLNKGALARGEAAAGKGCGSSGSSGSSNGGS